MKPLVLNISEEEQRKRTFYKRIIMGLKYMNRDDVFEIYGKLGNYNPKNISEIYIECDRSIIEIDGLKFYKSTGESRNIGLTDIWLPYEGCEKTLTNRERVIKSEDKYIDDWNANKINSILIENDKYDLEKYKRFINKKYAIISKWLYDNYDTTNRTNKMRTKRRTKRRNKVEKSSSSWVTTRRITDRDSNIRRLTDRNATRRTDMYTRRTTDNTRRRDNTRRTTRQTYVPPEVKIRQSIDRNISYNNLTGRLEINRIKNIEDNKYMIILKSSRYDKNFNTYGYGITDDTILNNLGIKNIDFHHTIIYKDNGNNFDPISNHTTCQLQINNFTVSIRYGISKESTGEIFWVGVESSDENACPFKDGLNIPVTINNNGKYKKTYYLTTKTPSDVILTIITLCSLEDTYVGSDTFESDFFIDYKNLYKELSNINSKIISLYRQFSNVGQIIRKN